MDGRVRPDRIAKVLREIDADIVALQEVLSREEAGHKHDHAGYVADELGYYSGLGENRRHKGAAYGNLLLTRFPIHTTRNYDITALGREQRGCLRADLKLDDGSLLHVFNVHMGTAFFERRKQARKLLDAAILTNDNLTGARLVLGDFNEWTHGLASRLLRSHFHAADPRAHLGRKRTYPGLLPLLHLDHIYFDPALKLESLTLHRSRTALVASDHLPFVADFSFHESERDPLR
jgi:endonuclease/exonuclease/phosphatase family metal-dependent hydrolase